MKVCEICGSISEVKEENKDESTPRILHVCDNCLEERKSLP